MKKLIILAILLYVISANGQPKNNVDKGVNTTWQTSVSEGVKSISAKGCEALKNVVNNIDEEDVVSFKNKVSNSLGVIKEGIKNM